MSVTWQAGEGVLSSGLDVQEVRLLNKALFEPISQEILVRNAQQVSLNIAEFKSLVLLAFLSVQPATYSTQQLPVFV